MSPRHRKVAVIAGTAALAVGAGVGVAAQGSGSAGEAAAMSRQGGGMQPGRGGPGRMMDLSALAKELGVTEAKLRSAMQAVRPTGRPRRRRALVDGGRAREAARPLDREGRGRARGRAARRRRRPPPGGAQGAPPSGGGTAPSTGDSTSST